MTNKPNLFSRLFTKLWAIINTTRKIILNLIFFMFLFIFIIALNSDDDDVVIAEKTALLLNISGDIVEQKKKIDPIDAFLAEAMNNNDKTPEVLLSDIIEVIDHAKNDDRVTLLVLQLENMNRSGITKVRDVAKALERFKESGKTIIAIGQQYTQDQYYLASYADKIWLDPKGWMIIDGYGRYQMYFKSALDKLAISQHIFRVGTYKSAVEPYMRDDMSEAAKVANKEWLNDLWLQYKTDVAKQRGFGIDNFDESLTGLISKFKLSNSNFADYALDNHWVDELKTHQQTKSALIELVGKAATGKSYAKVNFKDYLTHITPAFPIDDITKDKIAIIVAKGTILDGNQAPGTIGGDSTAKLLRKAREDKSVKAVVLRVDSPGGSAYASEIIRREVDLIKAAGKPVVASMGTYAASGGYWISAPADKIIASPTTITGSIGIFGLMMTFEKSLSKLGIFSDGVATTELAGFGVTRPLSEGMSALFQLNIDKGYQDFITLVAKNRDMTLEQVDKIAQGRVWSGAKAKELGLVDELGDLSDAIIAAAELADIDNYETLLIEKEISEKDKLLQKIFGQANLWFASDEVVNKDPLAQLINKLRLELSYITQLNDPQGVYIFCMTCEIN